MVVNKTDVNIDLKNWWHLVLDCMLTGGGLCECPLNPACGKPYQTSVNVTRQGDF